MQMSRLTSDEACGARGKGGRGTAADPKKTNAPQRARQADGSVERHSFSSRRRPPPRPRSPRRERRARWPQRDATKGARRKSRRRRRCLGSPGCLWSASKRRTRLWTAVRSWRRRGWQGSHPTAASRVGIRRGSVASAKAVSPEVSPAEAPMDAPPWGACGGVPGVDQGGRPRTPTHSSVL